MSQPAQVQMYVMSPNQRQFGAGLVKSRAITFGATGFSWFESVVVRYFCFRGGVMSFSRIKRSPVPFSVSSRAGPVADAARSIAGRRAAPGSDPAPCAGQAVLRGWGNYFRTGNASLKFQRGDSYVRVRLLRLLARRGGQRRKGFRWKDWPHQRFVKENGLYQLLGTIRYPGGVHAT